MYWERWSLRYSGPAENGTTNPSTLGLPRNGIRIWHNAWVQLPTSHSVPSSFFCLLSHSPRITPSCHLSALPIGSHIPALAKFGLSWPSIPPFWGPWLCREVNTTPCAGLPSSLGGAACQPKGTLGLHH